jgi:hypothetical protein
VTPRGSQLHAVRLFYLAIRKEEKMMARQYLLATIILVLMTTLTAVSVWAVPSYVSYQGLLVDSTTGNPVTDPGLPMTFRIYDTATGGILQWEEEHASVAVDEGIYHVMLGSGTTTYGSFDADLFSSDYLWLEVEINGEIFDPRQQVTSVAYAFQAGGAASAKTADYLDGLDSTDFAADSHIHSFSDLTGTASDDQIPDQITIHYATMAGNADYATDAVKAGHATTAGDADTVDGQHASAFGSAAQVATNQAAIAALQTAVATLQSQMTALETANTALHSQVAALESLLQHFSRNGNQVYITGANLHIVDGSGTTDGTTNSRGNLIVGYNELRGTDDDRTGSHNIVVGPRHNYSSYGGLVVGYQNTISGAHSSVSGALLTRPAAIIPASAGAGTIRPAVTRPASAGVGTTRPAVTTPSWVEAAMKMRHMGTRPSDTTRQSWAAVATLPVIRRSQTMLSVRSPPSAGASRIRPAKTVPASAGAL